VSARPAIFLDRDGTLNEAVGYLNHPSRLKLYPWSVEAVRTIRDEGYLAILTTNQSGVARGLIAAEALEAVHAELRRILQEAGTPLDGIYCCPHGPGDGCECRKPKPGLLRRAASELDVDLARSWVVGDSLSDLEAAWSVGARAALVRTGYGEGALQYQRKDWARNPDLVAPDLHRAVCAIFWGAID
jgi:D-glycero-D-manno-heptose 1,7-bisphosphate phosphatase